MIYLCVCFYILHLYIYSTIENKLTYLPVHVHVHHISFQRSKVRDLGIIDCLAQRTLRVQAHQAASGADKQHRFTTRVSLLNYIASIS